MKASLEEGRGAAYSSIVSSKLPKWPLALRIVPLTIGKDVVEGGAICAGLVIMTLTSR